MSDLPDIDPWRVRVFLAIARTGTFHGAAGSVGLTQPAVSAALRGLEEVVGARLLERGRRGSRLTPEGEAFLSLAAPAYDAWCKLGEAFRVAASGEPRGTVRLGAGEMICLHLLPRVLAGFRRSHPAVDVRLHQHPRETTLRMLRTWDLDLGIRSAGGLEPGLRFDPLVTTPRLVIAPRGARVGRRPSIETLSSLGFVVPPRGTSSRVLVEAAHQRAGVPFRISVEAGGWEVLKASVAAGLGVAVVPELCLTASDRRRLAVSAADRDSFPPESYGIVTREGAALSSAAAALKKRIVDAVR